MLENQADEAVEEKGPPGFNESIKTYIGLRSLLQFVAAEQEPGLAGGLGHLPVLDDKDTGDLDMGTACEGPQERLWAAETPNNS